MSQEEMMEFDLRTIYKLIEIHSEVNNPNPKKKDKNIKKETDSFIDNIKF